MTPIPAQKQAILDSVIAQIMVDLEDGDLQALEELLSNLPDRFLEAYLPCTNPSA